MLRVRRCLVVLLFPLTLLCWIYTALYTAFVDDGYRW